MTSLLKFGFHDFLNAQPLLLPLEAAARESGFEIVRDTPASLADRLRAGELDLAMIPSIEYLSHASRYKLVPGACIASRGQVETVLLVAQCPLEDVRAVALDERSRTSATLVRILFEDVFPPDVQYSRMQADLPNMMRTCSAALVIGDQGFAAHGNDQGWKVYDLGRSWTERTGRAFVHAVVAARSGVTLPAVLLKALAEAPAQGRAALDHIVREQAPKTGLDPAVVRDYLEHKIIYTFGPDEVEGLKTFRDLCFQKKILEGKPDLEWVG